MAPFPFSLPLFTFGLFQSIGVSTAPGRHAVYAHFRIDQLPAERPGEGFHRAL